MAWEYRVRELRKGAIIEEVLDKMGLDNWELVASHLHYGYVVVYMKRPKITDRYGK